MHMRIFLTALACAIVSHLRPSDSVAETETEREGLITLAVGLSDNIENETEDPATDVFFNPSLGLVFRRELGQELELGLGCDLDQEIYLQNREADNYMVSGMVELTGAAGGVLRWTAAYLPSFLHYGHLIGSEQDDGNYLRNAFALRLTQRRSKHLSLEYGARLWWKTHQDADREDNGGELGVRCTRSVWPAFLATLGLRLQNNQSSEPEYDYRNCVLDAVLVKPFTETTYLLGIAQYHLKDYPERPIDEGEDGGGQNSQTLFLVISLIHEISETYSAEIGYSLQKNSSNAESAEYTANTVRAALEIRF